MVTRDYIGGHNRNFDNNENLLLQYLTNPASPHIESQVAGAWLPLVFMVIGGFLEIHFCLPYTSLHLQVSYHGVR